jgi:hypothetical protein
MVMPILTFIRIVARTHALILTVLFAHLFCGPARSSDDVHFPLRIEPGIRYLSDASGKPFLIHGDTAWSLIAQLTKEEADYYLADRRAKGFNSLLVSLIEHQFSSNAPANIYNIQPFRKPGDFSTPNEQYFAHADWILKRAADYGLIVFLTPSYVGAGGGGEGWFQSMAENGPDKLREYGRYLGRRYRDFNNIIWVNGGDECPAEKVLVRAIAEGVRSEAPNALHTAHCARDIPPIDFWRGESWLDVNSLYTYGSVLSAARREYARAETMPFILIEAIYENEHLSSEHFLRMQAYHALLSGAAGQIFGNNPIWHFGSGGLFPSPVTWKEALNGRGSQSMSHLAALFRDIPWWKLKPDDEGLFLKGERRSEGEIPSSAVIEDGTLAVVYVPDLRTIMVDLSRLSGTVRMARWFDPAGGTFSDPLDVDSSGGFADFQPAGRNSSGTTDWVLIVEAAR